MALAANSLSYFPPRNIMQMEADLALLPLWWAKEGDCIVVPKDISLEYIQSMSDMEKNSSPTKLPHVNIISDNIPLSNEMIYEGVDVSPWGWSLALRHRFLRMGIPEISMPTSEQVEDYRIFSSRAFAVEYIQQLFVDADIEGWGKNIVGRGMKVQRAPIPASTEMEVTNEIADSHLALPLGGDANRAERDHSLIYKTLWSSSGRGVFVCHPDVSFNSDRINASIRKQGGILVDDFYEDKLLDFALEFEITDTDTSHIGCSFLGYSVFEASDSGTYGGNIVTSQDNLRKRILSTGVSESLLDKIVEYTTFKLGELLRGHYVGVFGVDMLICRHEGEIKIHPCIEINLRRNMGILAIDVYRRLGENANAVLAGNPNHGFCAKVIDGKLNIICK